MRRRWQGEGWCMAENTKIEWADHTFNPWRGCTKVSPGCEHCYAEALSKRTGHGEYRHGVPRERMSEAYWKQARKWNDQPLIWDESQEHRRARVFCASLSDWLDDEVPIEWLGDLLKLIHETPNLDWLLLTKRPENWSARLIGGTQLLADREERNSPDGICRYWFKWLEGNAPPNVWVGTTVEDQQRADERIPELLKIPAKVRFLSCEPLLGPVDLTTWLPNQDAEQDTTAYHNFHNPEDGIHWVICGGESGPNARPMHPDWARSLRDQCQGAAGPFFFKQWGEWVPVPEVVHAEYPARSRKVLYPNEFMARLGKKEAGRLLDGREWSEFPEVKKEVARG